MPENESAALTGLDTLNQPQNDDCDFAIQFWGVRGRIPTPGKETLRYGGNTSCVQIRVGGQQLIFDGGTGLRQLGSHLLKEMPIKASIFFTHCYWDRIQGFPFFIPAFIPANQFSIYGTAASNGSSFKQRLYEQMLHPNFPVPIQVMQSELQFYSIEPNEVESLGNVIVETCFLNYAHRSVGYRITYKGKSVVYATDTTESSDEQLNADFGHLARQADLLILDASSSTPTLGLPATSHPVPWQRSVEIAKEVGVKRLVMSIYDPDHSDEFLDELQQKVQSLFPNTIFAHEGLIIPL
ncbi:MAG: MBL fold metallo-hydrolase [Chroococcales cyanobacterium]